MKVFSLIFAVVMFFTGGVQAEARPQDDVTIRIGKTKSVDKGRLQIKFVSIIEDSRCPMNARCIWAGNARIKVLVSSGRGTARTIELNTGDDPRPVSVFGYKLELADLKPHKGDPSPGDLKPSAVISVTKNS